MSTNYGYRCKTCPPYDGDHETSDVTLSRSDDWGVSPVTLYSLLECVDEIKALVDKLEGKPCAGWLEITWLGHAWYPGPHNWLLAHHGHSIEVEDEYEHPIPIEALT